MMDIVGAGGVGETPHRKVAAFLLTLGNFKARGEEEVELRAEPL